MDTFPFHWDTLDASQCPRMACLCPDECHEALCYCYICFWNIFLCKLLLCDLFSCKNWLSSFHFRRSGFVTYYLYLLVLRIVTLNSFQSMPTTAPPPEYTPPAAKVQALSFRLPYTRTGCQSIFLKRRPIRSFFRRMMHNKHEKIPYLNICLLFMQGLRQQKAVKPGNACWNSGSRANGPDRKEPSGTAHLCLPVSGGSGKDWRLHALPVWSAAWLI